MNNREIEQAKKILRQQAERFSTMIYGRGQCLTAHWTDGGQKIFYTLDSVKAFAMQRQTSSEVSE